jgi:bacteriorhodopsin
MDHLSSISLWVGVSLMMVGIISFGVLRFRKATPASRGFYDKSIMIVTIAAIAYLAMALGFGSLIPGGQAYRIQIPRYIDWLFTTPLLLLDLILFARPLLGENWQWDTAMIILFDDVMILTGIFAAVNSPPYRWVWFWVSVAAYVVVALRVIDLYRRAADMPDARVRGKLRVLTVYLSAFWFIYPFIFALYFGGVISAGAQDVSFMILDVGAKVGFGFVLLLGPAVDLIPTIPPLPGRARGRGQGEIQAGGTYAPT